MEQNLQRLGVRREDDKLGDAAVERLRRLVRALLELLVVLEEERWKNGASGAEGGQRDAR